MTLIESSVAFPLFVSNVVTILLIVFFGRDRTQQQEAYKYQKARLQSKALIAQMNPHFIYNTLNGIQSTMLLKGEKEANRYIGIFSHLMRKTFEMSALEKISLSEEVDFLKNYISLQGMRLNYLIKSRYEIDPALDLEVAEIPALMVQPLVENAILHGISPLKKSGELTIRFIREGSTLFVEVEDNGVGRKKAQKYKARIKKKNNKFPSATKILVDRIDLYNYMEKTAADFKLEDRMEAGELIGTKATLKLPNLIKTKKT